MRLLLSQPSLQYKRVVMGCIKELMVTYSAFLLKYRAKDWWKALQRRHPEGITWGSILVAEYEKKFSDLIRAVPFIADNEEQKVNRFAVGLNPKIRAYVSSAAYTQFRSLVEAATRVERSMEAIPKPKKQKRGWTVDQKTDLKHQGIPAEVEDSREVEASPADPVPEEADATPKVVTGTITVFNHDAYVL
ncbi:hypothetical protein JRO89_XS02G0222000 [Xanthoceras sorbifolium]|uniref:Retrotransposon gag domain-containing protein n=1 Tax=Xanthoceras sorbifolium TaxID=99658 RepID=A0ABQ8IGK0_9ROSI|nr:hypothetical protein JRO89_XS02G0222000 [Xanthoceras sorbifolium]